MTNLNSILKEFNDLKKIEKFVTYQYLCQYSKNPTSKRLIEKKISALDEKKSNASIDDSVFNTVIQRYQNTGCIQNPLFQRQINRDLVKTPRLIQYSLKLPLFESKKKRSSQSWYSIMQKEISEKETHRKTKNNDNNNCIKSFNIINKALKRPFTRGNICKRSVIVSSNKTKRHNDSQTLYFDSDNHSPNNINDSYLKDNKQNKKSDEKKKDKPKRKRNRSNFDLAQHNIMPLTSFKSSKFNEHQQLTNAFTHYENEGLYYNEITREVINPGKSFIIYKPHFTFAKMKQLKNPKENNNFDKGKIKEYLAKITLRRSKSKKKKLIFLLAPLNKQF